MSGVLFFSPPVYQFSLRETMASNSCSLLSSPSLLLSSSSLLPSTPGSHCPHHKERTALLSQRMMRFSVCEELTSPSLKGKRQSVKSESLNRFDDHDIKSLTASSQQQQEQQHRRRRRQQQQRHQW